MHGELVKLTSPPSEPPFLAGGGGLAGEFFIFLYCL